MQEDNLILIINIAEKLSFRWQKSFRIDREDIQQEVSLYLWQHIDKYDPSKGSFHSYMYKVGENFLKHLLLKEHQSGLHLEVLGSDLASEDGTDPLESMQPSYGTIQTDRGDHVIDDYVSQRRAAKAARNRRYYERHRSEIIDRTKNNRKSGRKDKC